MYLYIFIDGTIKQLQGNPTVVDLMGCAAGTLKIVKYNVKKKIFLQLVISEANKLIWETVSDSTPIKYDSWRVNT